jgi:hypothetical protein
MLMSYFLRRYEEREVGKDSKSSTQSEEDSSHVRRSKKVTRFGKGVRSGKGSSTGFIHIKEVVDTIFAAPAFQIDIDDLKIWKIWDRAVGKRIAKHARPSTIKRGVLVVKVSDSVWLQELEFKAEDIRTRLNSELKREAIKRIRFKVGEPQGAEPG